MVWVEATGVATRRFEMQLTQSLNIKQKQSLVMTPQLQQAIKLLQLTNLELKQFLEEQTFDNPFINVEEETQLSEKKGYKYYPNGEERH
jgi:DNA-directed RNA polymerase specialized sigma54-like protein